MSVAPRFPLRATYRLQLHGGFDLDAAAACAEQLAKLGISHLYLSPVFEARDGSTHGYDLTDPTRVRSALGGSTAFDRLLAATRRHELGILLDIVPNHMAASEQNAWFRDVLEFGEQSPFYGHFDFSWRAAAEDARIALPVLGQPLDAVIESGEIGLTFDELGFAFTYYDRRFPIAPRAYSELLATDAPAASAAHGGEAAERIQQLRMVLQAAHGGDERHVRQRVLDEAAADPSLRAELRAMVLAYGAADERAPGGARDRLLHLLERQHYRLGYWRDVDRLLSYRRFFDITDLIGVRVEDDHVFADTHARVLEWIATGAVEGVRIDHIDGLHDPTGYALQLRRECSAAAPERPVPILVEKILARDEQLPATWPVDGTTGYEFLNVLNGLFVASPGLERITLAYREATDMAGTFADITYAKKKQVLDSLFAGEWRVLARELTDLLAAATEPAAAQQALREITACLPVYRTYIRRGEPVGRADAARIRAAIDDALKRGAAEPAELERVGQLLCLSAPGAATDAIIDFVMRWQQLTGPVMAKGLEDTALYTFHPLVSINDVGGAPDHGVCPPAALHAFLAARAERMPDTLNATSSHDTKRSEDVRARINVLSELPGEWLDHWQRWRTMNRRVRARADAPTANEEYLLYQSLIGAWPHEAPARRDFRERMQRYMLKAVREAKANTSWLEPQDDHEQAVATFVEHILDADANAQFLRELDEFVARVAPLGVRNALAQTAIKAWAPGVPDFYQGTEAWRFDLVDPDNRRPVNFAHLDAMLRDVSAQLRAPQAATAAAWLADWQDGRIKMLITAAALQERRAAADLFAFGAYRPLVFEGRAEPHLFGFAREHHGHWRAVIVTRLHAALDEALPAGGARWSVPPGAPRRWRNVVTGTVATAADDGLDVGTVLESLPVALLAAV